MGYSGISLLSSLYEIVSNTNLTRMTPFETGIIGEYQYGFRRNRSTDVHIFSIGKHLKRSANTVTT